jgi:hypothetical protein
VTDRPRSSKNKTLPIAEGDATSVGFALPGWDEKTAVGAPPGWETLPDQEQEHADWEVDRTLETGDRTLERQEPIPEAARRTPVAPTAPLEQTIAGPPADFDRGGSGHMRASHVQVSETPRSEPRQRAAGVEPSSPGHTPPERPPIEIEVRKVSNATSLARRVPPALEIWTKNRVYALDLAMQCVDVIDLASGQSDKRHPFIQGRLVGGQRRVSDGNELTFPLPIPGAEAVFQVLDANGRPRLVVTSRVTRVILHVQVVRVTEQQRDDTLGKIASTRDPSRQ